MSSKAGIGASHPGTFGGTAGITGTSANFVAGVLTGASVTPMAAGPDLTLSVNDGSDHTGSTTFSVQSRYESWANSHGATGGSAADTDGDSLSNLQEFAFETDPNSPVLPRLSYEANVSVTPGLPVLENTGTLQSPGLRAVFIRRNDYEAAGLNYEVQFSANLTYWQKTIANGFPAIPGATNSAVEVVAVPFPNAVPLSDTVGSAEAPPKFFRMSVTTSP